MEALKLTANELRYLEYLAVSNVATLAAIRNNSDIHPKAISRSSASLENKGLIELARKRLLSKTVMLAKSKHAQLFRRLVLEYRHMQFHRLLSDSALEVLAAICTTDVRSRKEIHNNSSVSEASVARVLTRLKRVGIVMKKKSAYKVSDRFQTLADFVLEFRHYLNEGLAQSFSNDAVIIWERNAEFIIETMQEKKEKKGFRLTGPSAFGKFDVVLMMPVSYYFHSLHDKKLEIDDVIVHSLLLREDERNALAILLIWKKNEENLEMLDLTSKAKRYGVLKEMEAFSGYLNSAGKERNLPTLPLWNEFAAKANEYGIKL